jgi:hypothetical protein
MADNPGPVLVTGANSGIGLATTLLLIRRGWNLADRASQGKAKTLSDAAAAANVAAKLTPGGARRLRRQGSRATSVRAAKLLRRGQPRGARRPHLVVLRWRCPPVSSSARALSSTRGSVPMLGAGLFFLAARRGFTMTEPKSVYRPSVPGSAAGGVRPGVPVGKVLGRPIARPRRRRRAALGHRGAPRSGTVRRLLPNRPERFSALRRRGEAASPARAPDAELAQTGKPSSTRSEVELWPGSQPESCAERLTAQAFVWPVRRRCRCGDQWGQGEGGASPGGRPAGAVNASY